MNNKQNQIAAKANIKEYKLSKTNNYIHGAPHLKHKKLFNLFEQLAFELFNPKTSYRKLSVLDLGAGEGSSTRFFLRYNFDVFAVDSSLSQLNELRKKCKKDSGNLTTIKADVFSALEMFETKKVNFDIIVLNSFLHHIPDYLELIRRSSRILKKNGKIFTYQDPVKYSTLSFFESIISNTFYFLWRIFQGDVIRGVMRKLRRMRGVYLEDSIFDNAEYHVTRGGVDQFAIIELLKSNNFDTKIVYYFSTQNSILQKIGSALQIKNTFSILARKI
jgi:ubiquinone/menaquinone biosynthesis C-methylase UbiE